MATTSRVPLHEAMRKGATGDAFAGDAETVARFFDACPSHLCTSRRCHRGDYDDDQNASLVFFFFFLCSGFIPLGYEKRGENDDETTKFLNKPNV